MAGDIGSSGTISGVVSGVKVMATMPILTPN